MKISDWLFEAMEKLGKAGVDSPRRDGLVLLEDTLQKDRAWVLAHPDYELAGDELEKVNALVARRAAREPLAYIRGKAWFYKRFFTVNEQVLIPRPESEAFIDLAKLLKPASAIDVGTGCGALAITLALEIPTCEITATDIDSEALEVCRKNAYAHKVKLRIKQAYLLDSLLENEAPELVLANLPYVPEDLITSPEILAEPKSALFGGPGGMDVYENFWAQTSTAPHQPRYVMTESLETQHTQMNNLAARSGYKLIKTEGLVQKFERL